jgi:hypothetical protein
MIDSRFVILGAIIQLFGGLSYLIDTLKGKVRPNRVSWLLWSIAPLIAFVAEIKQGVGILSLTTFIVGFMPMLIFISSFVNKKAQWRLTKFDVLCGVLSVAGLVLWLITNVGNIAIVCSILADAIAGFPTIVKSYKEPESENDLPFTLGVVNSGIAILVISEWNIQNYAFPVYLFFINLLIAILIRSKIGRKK